MLRTFHRVAAAMVVVGVFATIPVAAQSDAFPDFRDADASASSESSSVSSTGDLVIEDCQVRPLSEPALYASESGLLELVPEVGDEVEEGQVVARIDDSVAVSQLEVKQQEYRAAYIRSASDVEQRYAVKSADVREQAYLVAKEANAKAPGAVSATEVRRREFDWQASILSIEKAENDHDIARADAGVKFSEMNLAEKMVQRHKIKSPVTGIVQERIMHQGEWVKPGDPIARLIRMDRLRVIGDVDLSYCPPHKLKGQSVIIEMPTRFDGQGGVVNRVEIPATIVHVGVEVGASQDYAIWAEFDNPPEISAWPGVPEVRMRLKKPNF